MRTAIILLTANGARIAAKISEKVGRRLDIGVKQVKESNIERTAMIVVGHCLNSKKEPYQMSNLYSPKFSHIFRQARF